MSPRIVGIQSEGQILARLLQQGTPVSIPFGDCHRYDFVIEEKDGTLKKVQCKTGCVREGCVRVRLCSVDNNGKSKGYKGQIDLFMVYCPDNDKFYRFGVDEFSSNVFLRLDQPASAQVKNIKWARDFEW